MKANDFIILFGLIVILGVAIFALWAVAYKNPAYYQDYYSKSYNFSNLTGGQFYPNMRYRQTDISYSFSSLCSNLKKANVKEAFGIISRSTILKFYEKSANGEIEILCSDVAPTSEREGHIIAGEGGPSKIINTSRYNLIFNGKVSLYRDDSCNKPQIALHEILHSLGFEHTSQKSSIMYPVTNCGQEVDSEIFDEINVIYKDRTLPDLEIESLVANKTGSYLNFMILVANSGLDDAKDAKLKLVFDNSRTKEFELGEIRVGAKKSLSASNIFALAGSGQLRFEVDYSGEELSKENNLAVISVKA